MIDHDKMFAHYMTLARHRIAQHVQHQDNDSARIAGFAAGRVVGLFNAMGQPAKWRDAIDSFQSEFYDKVGMA